MSGDLPLAINQLQLALAVPKITDVQRARFEARLDEVQQALPKRSAARRSRSRRRQSPPAELIQCTAAASTRRFRISDSRILDACSVHRCAVARVYCVALLAAGCAATPGRTDRRRSLGRRQSRCLQVQRHRRPRGAQAGREGLQEDHAALDAHRHRQFPRQPRVPGDDREPVPAGQGQARPARHRALPAQHARSASPACSMSPRPSVWKRTTKTSDRRSRSGASAPVRT